MPTRRKALASLASIGSVGVAGCFGGSNVGGDHLAIAGGDSDSALYQMMQAIAAEVNDVSDDLEVEISPVKSMQGLQRAAQGEYDMAVGSFTLAFDRNNNLGQYEDSSVDHELQTVLNFYQFHGGVWYSRTDSGIETTDDLQDGGLGIGAAGNDVHYFYVNLLNEVYGWEDLDTPSVPFSELAQGIDSGRIDAVMVPRTDESVIAAWAEELYSVDDIQLVEPTDDYLTGIEETDRFKYTWIPTEVTHPTDDQQDMIGDHEELPWTEEPYNLYANDAADDDLVYNFVDTVWDQVEEIAASHAQAEIWLEGVEMMGDRERQGTGIPAHAAANEFYEEQGV